MVKTIVLFCRWKETYTWNKVTTCMTNVLSATSRTCEHTGCMVIKCSNGMTSNVQFKEVIEPRFDNNSNLSVCLW